MPGKKKSKEKPQKKRKTKAQQIEEALSKLSLKQRALLENYVARKNRTEAAIAAGYEVSNPNSREGRKRLSAIGRQEMNRPDVKEALSLLLEKSNLGIMRLLDKISEGLEATKVVALVSLPAQRVGEKSQSGNELIEASEQAQSYAEVPDMAVRHKYLETALALHGLPEKRKEELQGQLPYHERIKRIWLEIGPDVPIDATATEVK